MEITAKQVSSLREQTGAGMMECKKALIEAEGDVERARDILRATGKAGAEKRSGRATSQGVVAVATGPGGSALVEVNSETDFVARNEEFRALAVRLAELTATAPAGSPEEVLAREIDGVPAQRKLDDVVAKLRENIQFRRCVQYPAAEGALVATYVHTVTHKIGVILEVTGDAGNEAQAAAARNVAMHIAASSPEYVTRADVPEDVLERERQVLAELTRNEGKPEAAIAKIVEGRLGKFFERSCLVDQPYVREPSQKVGDVLKAAGCEARRFTMFTVGQ